jgi:hypothetical protein
MRLQRSSRLLWRVMIPKAVGATLRAAVLSRGMHQGLSEETSVRVKCPRTSVEKIGRRTVLRAG